MIMIYLIVGCLGALLVTMGFLLRECVAWVTEANATMLSLTVNVRAIIDTLKFIEQEVSNTSLALIKLEEMAYKEHEESAMPTRTKIADLVTENKQYQETIRDLLEANDRLERHLVANQKEIDYMHDRAGRNDGNLYDLKSKTTNSD